MRWALKVSAKVVWEYARISEEPERRPRSVEDLHFIMKTIHRIERGTDIEVYRLYDYKAFHSAQFIGVTFRRRGLSTLILLNPTLTPKSHRFGLVLESFHALLDHEDLRTKNLAQSIETYIDIRRRQAKFESLEGAACGEYIAEIAAMEALFPYAERIDHAARLKSVAGDRLLASRVVKAISDEYGIPPPWVRLYLSEDMLTLLKPFHDGG